MDLPSTKLLDFLIAMMLIVNSLPGKVRYYQEDQEREKRKVLLMTAGFGFGYLSACQ
jgi:hypothetical protein